MGDEILAGEAHLHVLRLARFDHLSEEELAHCYGVLLSPEERARQKRPTLESKRREILLTRALARTVLSRYADVDPRDWRFGTSTNGRPFVADPKMSFDFNLAHTAGVIVCLVAAAEGVGVDVETMTRRTDLDEVAAHFFSPAENEALRHLPSEERRERFFTYWTLKEAYIKARGLGLTLPLDAFWFRIGDAAPAIAFDERISDDPAAWRFDCFRLSEEHRCATALKGGSGLKIQVIEDSSTALPTSPIT
jgi:4'-phosphopantetheinyl transferase